MSAETPSRPGRNERIHVLVRLIPAGRVATYGQLARMAGCGARVAGYAIAAVPDGSDVPWHRVINSQGRISPRSDKSGDDETRQEKLLRAEGVAFDKTGRVDLDEFRWDGPGWAWLEAHGFDPGRV